jgi:PBSX family phage terminase large subunit
MFDRMGIPYVKDMKAIQVFNFNFEDNPSLSEAVKDEFRKKYTGVFYKRMILGQWCVAEGRVYSSFTEENNIYDNERMPLYFDSYYIGIDYGSANVTTFLLIAENHDKKITRVIDEYYWDAKHLEECTEWAIDKSQENNYQKSDASFFEDFERFIDGYDIDGIYIDPNAKSFIKVVSDKYNVCEADNDVVNGIRVVSSKFEIGELQIDPKCKHTIEQHTSYSWDSSTDKKQVDKPLKQNDHTCDALRYPIYTRELNGYILKGFANAVNQATGR